MSENGGVALRSAVIALAVINVVFFAYARISLDNRAGAASRVDELQINPARIKLVNAATRGPGAGTAKSACLEWGPFGVADSAKAEAALQRIGLPRAPLQRSIGESGGAKRFAFYVREPDAGAVAQIAELQRGFPGTNIKAGPCPS